MEEDLKGVMWGMGKRGLYRFDSPEPVSFPCITEGTALEVTDMDVAPDGEIFVVAEDKERARLHSFRNGVYTEDNLPAEFRSEVVLKVHAGPSGNTWVATNKHLLCQSEGAWRMKLSGPSIRPTTAWKNWSVIWSNSPVISSTRPLFPAA
jgi:hypothetical protein